MPAVGKIWQVAEGGFEEIRTHDALEDFLCGQRGLHDTGSESFFTPDYARDIHDPHLLLGMGAAVERIFKAVQDKEHILVYGDYDADGISGTAIMTLALQAINAQVTPFLPDRNNGYGLSQEVIEGLADEFDLLISVDCGVANTAEIAWLKDRGKDVIVVDHHEFAEDLPPAEAILHPRHPQGKYPWANLSGAGMSWKLAQALLRDPRSPHAHDADFEKWFLDLALLGTVGDIMPLLGENRAIVQFGMQVMALCRRPAMRALMDAARLPVKRFSVEDVAYRLIPLINAAGRVGHPQSALDVLLAETDAEATQAAMRLLVLNKERQAITRGITEEALAVLDVQAPVMFAANMDWPAGVVGLVAGQLASKFGRPAVVVGGNGVHAVGSARSANGINILAGLRSAEEHALKLGGHEAAAGFSVAEDKLDDFRSAVQAYFSKHGSQPSEVPAGKADACLNVSLLDWQTHELVQRFEPYGEANPKPKFVWRNLPVIERRLVGKTGKHIKFRLALPQGDIDAIGFGLAGEAKRVGDSLDAIGVLDVNEFRGNVSLQLRLEDVATAGKVRLVTTNN